MLQINDTHTATLAEIKEDPGSEMLRLLYATLSQSSIENLEIDSPNSDNTKDECIDIFDRDTKLLFRIFSYEDRFWVENSREVGAKLKYDEVVKLITATDSSEIFTKVFQLIK